jgi:hypothetical protein
MVVKREGVDYRPKCETFFQMASKDVDLCLGIFQILHSFLSKENSKYQHDYTRILLHLASLLRKHKMPSHLLSNP